MRSLKSILALTLLALSFAASSRAEWTSLTTGVSDELYGLCFVSDSVGFATGWGAGTGNVTLRTVDAGDTWEPYNHPNGTLYFGMTFADAMTGYQAGYLGGASISRTINGGDSWEHVPIPGSFGLYVVEFPTPEIGYTCGYDGGIFNSLGQAVATLLNTDLKAGSHVASFDAAALSSGLYFYRLEAGNFTAVKKMSLVK